MVSAGRKSPTHEQQPARFWSVDLHVHTPASGDVRPDRYGAESPHEVVDAALAAGLDAIAITDHNTVDWCDGVADAAGGTTLTVLPGAEITTTEGHLLAIWPEGTTLTHMQDVLTGLGIDRSQQGNIEVSSPKGIAEVAQRVAESGGLAIAAHIDRERGVLKNQAADHIRRILLTPELAALEIVNRDTQGQVERKLGDERISTFVQNSDVYPAGGDTHMLSAIGRRRTWIKSTRPDLVGMAHAFKDLTLRVRLDEPLAPAHCWIKCMKVRGGFLDGQVFDFSSDLNCLLGGTGTGKSLALELIRFVLDDQTDKAAFEKVREEVDRRLEAALGTDSSVEVTLALKNDDLVVRRAYDASGSPAPEIISDHSEAEWQRRAVIRAFSQGEVIEYAREPVARLQLIDAALDLEPVESEIQKICDQLSTNGEELCGVERDIADAETQLGQLQSVKERVKELSTLFEADIVQNQESWTKEERRFKDPAALLDTEADLAIKTHAKFSYEVEIAENADLYGSATDAIQAYTEAIASANAAAAKARRQALKDLDAISKEWTTRFEAFERKLGDELAKVKDEEHDLDVLRRRLQRLQREQGELEEIGKKLNRTYRPRRKRLLEKRERLIERLVAARHTRRDMRRERVKDLNRRMSGAVRISLSEEVDAVGFEQELTILARGSGFQKSYRQRLQENASPIHLVRSFIAKDAASVAKATDVPEHRIQVLFEHMRDGHTRDFLKLQAIDIADGLRVQFRKPATDSYEDIEYLAHGEKCTAILIIAMAEGTEPLIIDQPEDALHAPWIEEHLVWRLRELRGLRQYVFATRSPSIVISADADMITTLEANVTRGEVITCGSLERHDLNELALYHLEGGAGPFKRRTEKFSVSLEGR